MAGRQFGGQKQVHLFVQDAGRHEESGNRLDPSGAIAGLFDKLAPGRLGRVLVRLARAGRQLQELLTDRQAVVLDQANPAVAQDRHHGNGAGMPHDLVDVFPSVLGPIRFLHDAKESCSQQGFRFVHGRIPCRKWHRLASDSTELVEVSQWHPVALAS